MIFEVGVFVLEVVPREGAAVDRPFPFALWQRVFGRADDKAMVKNKLFGGQSSTVSQNCYFIGRI